jgi:hypothetical protein
VDQSESRKRANRRNAFLSWHFFVGVALFAIAEVWNDVLPPRIQLSPVGWFALMGASIAFLFLSNVRPK